MKLFSHTYQWLRPKDLISKYFLATATVFGLGFVFLTPPFCSFDEGTHSYRAYQLSELNFLADDIPGGGTGGYVTSSLYETATRYRNNYFGSKHQISKSEFLSDLGSELNFQDKIPVHFENTALYSAIGYSPHVLAIWAGRTVNASPLTILYMARLFYLALWIVLVLVALKLLQAKKLFVALIVLSPMSLFLAGSVSLDGVTTALTVMLIGLVSAQAVNSKISSKQILFASALSTLLALVKLPYFLFSALFIFVGRNKNPNNIFVHAVPLICGLVVAGVWSLLSRLNYLPYRKDVYINPDEQLKNILLQPWEFLQATGGTFLTNFGEQLPREFVGVLGSNNSLLPSWISYMWIVLLALTTIYGAKDKIKHTKNIRVASLVIIAVVFMSLNALMYMSWTTPGHSLIDGMMGRYLLPIAAMLAIPLAGVNLLRVDEKRFEKTIFVFVWVGLSASIMSMLQFNYQIL